MSRGAECGHVMDWVFDYVRILNEISDFKGFGPLFSTLF